MKRTRAVPFIPADAILVADLHLTETPPISRTDDYLGAQSRKMKFLQDLRAKHGCPVLCAGDVFHKWKNSPWFCVWAFHHIPGDFITIPGNHDLPHHSFAKYDKSSLYLLETVGQLTVLAEEHMVINGLGVMGVPFGKLETFDSDEVFIDSRPLRGRKILLLHELIWPNKKPSWSKDSYTSREILDRFGGNFDLIVTGDNHESFTARQGDSLLVNPGSMMRITAAQGDYAPKCYLYYAKDNTVKPVEFPIDEDVHDREHLDQKKARDARITAYIERLNDHWELGLSFRKNLMTFMVENNVPCKVREIVWGHMPTN